LARRLCNIAAAGLRNWTLNLHNALKPHGIYVAHMAISAWIGSESEHHYVALPEADVASAAMA
jgi:hypothetical protein